MGEISVRISRRCGSEVYSAWEPAQLTGTHHTVMGDGIGWLGRVGTRRLPGWIEAMPAGELRTISVCDWHARQCEEAYGAILAGHPEAADGVRERGEIILACYEVEE